MARKNIIIYHSPYDDRKLPAEKQIKFLAPESFHRQLETEKVLQKRPMQELLCEALEQALHAWERDRAIDLEVARDSEERWALDQGLIEVKTEQFMLRQGELRWVNMWLAFMRELPQETVDAQRRILQDVLGYFRASRRKRPPQKKVRGKNDGETRTE